MHDKQEMYETGWQLSNPAQLFEEKSFLLAAWTPLLYCQHYVREPKVIARTPGVLGSMQVSFLPEVFAVGKSDKKTENRKGNS